VKFPLLDGETLLPTPEQLQAIWQQLAEMYFNSRLPTIRIEWSSRLTASAGMFVSRIGPRDRHAPPAVRQGTGRIIRLSAPLLSGQPKEELIRILAHEMIHQWEFDIRKRRPSHGLEFRNMMHRMNQDGMGISIYHRLHDRVESRYRFTWNCLMCGYAYHRQRRTIVPARHRCGQCGGRLLEFEIAEASIKGERRSLLPAQNSAEAKDMQLSFAF
jgi:predicted SprT family Zn-dependent metalloprotease